MQRKTIVITIMFISLMLSLFGQAIAQNDTTTQLGQPVYTEDGSVGVAFSGCGGVTTAATNRTFEQEVAILVNAERVSQGLPPLKLVDGLDNAARYHATDMGDDDYFEHNSYDRVGESLVAVTNCDFTNRLASFDYEFISAAENIAAGQVTPTEVMSAWLNSPTHRENIERTSVWEIGVGYYDGNGSMSPYWVQNFGRRLNLYPVIINNEAIETDSTGVSLYLYGIDDWEEYRLRNDGGTWSDWQDFTQSTVSWTLENLNGEREVELQLRRNGSETVNSRDTILLTAGDSATPTPTTTPTVTPSATLSATVSTATPTVTETPAGRPTVPSGETATSTPTATASPTATPTSTPTVTSTPDLRTATPGARPTTDSGATATPFPLGGLSGVVNLQGRTDYSNTEIWVSDEPTCPDSPTSASRVTMTDSIGFFELGTPAGSGAYRCLYVMQDDYLMGLRTVTQAGDQGSITLRAGDMNGDNQIDIFDVAYVAQRYETTDLTADLNLDGTVNIFDVSIVSGNYQRVGPQSDWQ